jgi:hypothetical protein
MAEVVKQNQAHRVDDVELEEMLRLVENMTEEETQRYVDEMKLK